nr:MAG TPA: hypothetical protein [Caudoviricetes sp.]
MSLGGIPPSVEPWRCCACRRMIYAVIVRKTCEDAVLLGQM